MSGLKRFVFEVLFIEDVEVEIDSIFVGLGVFEHGEEVDPF